MRWWKYIRSPFTVHRNHSPITCFHDWVTDIARLDLLSALRFLSISAHSRCAKDVQNQKLCECLTPKQEGVTLCGFCQETSTDQKTTTRLDYESFMNHHHLLVWHVICMVSAFWFLLFEVWSLKFEFEIVNNYWWWWWWWWWWCYLTSN